MKLLKLAGLSLVAGVAALGADLAPTQLTSQAMAQQLTLDQVLRAVREERQKSAAENRRREQEFLSERNSQQQKVATVRRQKNAAKARSDELEAVSKANKELIENLKSELDEKNGEFRDLFGAAQSAANELKDQVQSSLISAQFPDRDLPLIETARSQSLPAIEELVYLWDTYMQEMTEQGKITTFTTDIAAGGGKTNQAEVTRVGPFVAISDGDFVVYKRDDEGKAILKKLARQPGSKLTSLASNLEGSSGGGYARGPVDPSLGTLLELTVDQPNLKERLDQGGPVGYTIVGIAAIGILIGLFKLVTLFLVNGAVKAQARSKRANKGNPLGRVMLAYEGTNTADTETVALKLDDAVLKEIPRLEGGLNFIKVLAAVAPLLGLLGTVIGMIETFQAITLFGTGDPQIMAGGISAALVTTVLGLIAAIPLLFLHAFASGSARSVAATLEERSAGIIAEHAEGRG